ncbi:MAG: sigma-54-dependent Fis family transcriptional regulator [Gammaproteobacteria bacterium]|nr:sigma-54-dependent Fis family transcriptional regulator [Gammaproteobacteria bacterium]
MTAQIKPKHKPVLLLVDDDPLIAETMDYLLRGDYDVITAGDRESAREVVELSPRIPQLALVDLGLPPVQHSPDEGFALIPELLAHNSHMKILVLSGQDEHANIRHALTLGAVDFIPKPSDAALLKARLQHQLMLLEAENKNHIQPTNEWVGSSKVMQLLVQQIQQFSDAPFPVLIEGESGAGKELVAQRLHDAGQRAGKPYLIINCAAFTKDLLEAQLFGYAKGSFTGAARDHAGFFEEAGDGSLFLDEIGELPLELQAKLLRVLENGEFYRLGETRPRLSRARIIAATNKHMIDEVRAGRFRHDLYHRLSILTIKVPPLSVRGDDRFELLDYFRKVYAGSVPPFSLSEAAANVWRDYDFPGNVRELRNVVIRLGTKYPGQSITIEQMLGEVEMGEDVHHLPQLDLSEDDILRVMDRDDFQLEHHLQKLEQQYVSVALRKADGNLSHASKLLKINRTTLYSRLQKLGLK